MNSEPADAAEAALKMDLMLRRHYASTLLALPAPAWHTDAGDRPEVFDIIDQSTSKQLFALLAEHESFYDTLRGEETIWDGSKILGCRKSWSMVRNLSYGQAGKLRDAARSVTFWLRSALLWRYRTEIGKREAAAEQAARTRKRKKASAKAFDSRGSDVSAPFARRAA